MTVPPAILADLKRRAPLSEIVGRDLPLRKAGSEFVALCPFHAEKSPSFYVNDKKGFWFCFGCGAHGDAIQWLMQARGLDFKSAVTLLNNGVPPDPARRTQPAAHPRVPDEDEAERQRKARWLWHRRRPLEGTVAERYLHNRGVARPCLPSLGFIDAPYWHQWASDSRPSLIGTFPALIAAIQDGTGHIVAVQLTYLTHDARKVALADRDQPGKLLKPKKVRGAQHDGAVRLGRVGEDATLGLAEGIETGLSAQEMFEVPVWCALGVERFYKVAIPAGVKKILLFADRSNKASWQATTKAATALEARGFDTDIEMPRRPQHKDFNDELQERGGPEA